jgi:hypothetical protein
MSKYLILSFPLVGNLSEGRRTIARMTHDGCLNVVLLMNLLVTDESKL